MTRLAEIRNRLGRDSGVKHNSPEEHAALEEARLLRKGETDEFAVVHGAVLHLVADKSGVVSPSDAREASTAAMEHITGEHEVVPALPPHETNRPQ